VELHNNNEIYSKGRESIIFSIEKGTLISDNTKIISEGINSPLFKLINQI